MRQSNSNSRLTDLDISVDIRIDFIIQEKLNQYCVVCYVESVLCVFFSRMSQLRRANFFLFFICIA